MNKRLKVLVTMIGLDSHTTGAETIAMMLRNAGVEVVYLGCNQTPQQIIEAAIHEDVDVVGISSHAMNYDQIEEVVRLAQAKRLDDVPVICGGNIPRHEAKRLKEKGVAAIFPPGSTSEIILAYLGGVPRAQAA